MSSPLRGSATPLASRPIGRFAASGFSPTAKRPCRKSKPDPLSGKFSRFAAKNWLRQFRQQISNNAHARPEM